MKVSRVCRRSEVVNLYGLDLSGVSNGGGRKASGDSGMVSDDKFRLSVCLFDGLNM